MKKDKRGRIEMLKEYPLTHSQGLISVEKEIPRGIFYGDIGVQIEGNKIWICIDNEAFIRFRTLSKKIVKDLQRQ